MIHFVFYSRYTNSIAPIDVSGRVGGSVLAGLNYIIGVGI
jgi:hypothetical protein